MSKELKWGALIAIIAASIYAVFGQLLIVNNTVISVVNSFTADVNAVLPNSYVVGIVVILLILINVGILITNLLVNKPNKWLAPLTAGLLLLTGIVYFYTPTIFVAATNLENVDVTSIFTASKPSTLFGLVEDAADVVFAGGASTINGLVSIILSIVFIREVFKTSVITVKDIAEMASLVGLALVLDLAIFKLKVVPNGGSISLVMVPLFIIALRKGPLKGVIACGIVFGFISCLIDGYGIVTYPFDYLLGFGSIALAGFFRKFIFREDGKITVSSCLFLLLAVFVGVFGRFVASTISGIILYGTDLVGSMIYQLTYLAPSSIIVLIALFLLYKPLIVINSRFKA
ncbi:MAG: energy-coupled thiamine transporter ThiT [Bacilli bacterium]